MATDILDQLTNRARETQSDGFTILHRGDVLAAHTFERTEEPICIMSVTKTVVGLAFGRLLDDGTLASLDTPVADIFPEWRQGRKRDVTIRMVLNHTSGMQNDPNAGIEIEPAPDWTRLALCAELQAEPGTVFAYNNKAVLLLPAVIERLVGQPLDVYLRDTLLAPLGITGETWFRDPAGTPFAAGGLHLRAADLARVGQLILERGTRQGKRIVSDEWIDTMTSPGQAIRPDFGLLCRLWNGEDSQTLVGVYHDGWMGQYLVVLPEQQIVIARVLARTPGFEHETHGFQDILDLARALAEA